MVALGKYSLARKEIVDLAKEATTKALKKKESKRHKSPNLTRELESEIEKDSSNELA